MGADLLKDAFFVNQRGRSFVGKEAVIARHKIVLAPNGPLGTKPAATYTIERIDGSESENHARALVAWKYPSHDNEGNPVVFTPTDPQQGYFIFTFLKGNGEWKIATLQNTPQLN